MIEIKLPQWGMSMSEGTVIDWKVAEGQTVTAGQELVEIEAAKVTDVVTSPEAGVVQQILVQVDETVEVNTVLCTIGHGPPEPVVEAAAPDESPARTVPPVSGRHPAQHTATQTHPVNRDADQARKTSGRVTGVVPLARKLAKEHGVDLHRVTGSGNQGRIVVADVQAVLDALDPTGEQTPRLGAVPVTAPPSPTSGTASAATPVSRMRSVIAERMLGSLQSTAQFTLTTTADMSAFAQFRADVAGGADKPSYVDAVIRACAIALQDHPMLNSRFDDDKILASEAINIGFAVALDEGLLVPVIPHADALGLAEVTLATADLSARARNGALSPDELDGGTFSITSLGGQGIDAFTPIINPPQSAILGIGRSREVAQRYGDGLVWRQEMTLSLTVDHRINDGYPAALFLGDVVDLLEQPTSLF